MKLLKKNNVWTLFWQFLHWQFVSHLSIFSNQILIDIKVEHKVNMIKINFPSFARSISSKCGHRADRNSLLHLIQCSKSYYHSNRTSICSAYILINKLRNFADKDLGKEQKLWNYQKNNMWTILWRYFALHFVSHFSRFHNGILSDIKVEYEVNMIKIIFS